MRNGTKNNQHKMMPFVAFYNICAVMFNLMKWQMCHSTYKTKALRVNNIKEMLLTK